MKFEIQIIAVLSAASCAVPGVFLVLRKMSMMSDAVSHAVLPGIVTGFILSKTLNSPLLIIGAVSMGIITVIITETVAKTNLVAKDAAIGVVFPVLFSIGVILVAKYAGNIHLDTDAVLLGELAFAPFDRLSVNGIDLGPKGIWTMGIIFILNITFLILFFKELKIATFDPGLAASFGFPPVIIHYALMIDVSLTAVGAFDAIGSILVVALMIAPAAAAYLITDNLKLILLLSILFGAVSAVSGFWAAWYLDASIAGAIASMTGIIFLSSYLFAPSRGLFSIKRKRKQQKLDAAVSMLTVHLLHHGNKENQKDECRVSHLQEHINWSEHFAKQVVTEALKSSLVTQKNDLLFLSEKGIQHAQDAMTG